MQLLLFNESYQITYFGECTILANEFNGRLDVTPTEEDFKVCPYVFKQHVIKLNNILFIFASGLYQYDFVLILPRVESCNKIFKAIQKAKDPNESQTLNAFDIHSAEFQQRSFLPILENIQTNEIHSNRLKEFICNFLKFLGKEERERYLVLIKEKSDELYSEIVRKGGFEEISSGDTTISEAIEAEANQQPELKLFEIGRKLRKRKRNEANIEPENDENGLSDKNYQSGESDISDSDFHEDIEEEELKNESETVENHRQPKKFKHDSLREIVKAPNFKLLEYDEYGTLRKKLFIFPTEDKTLCYVYGWSTRKNRYVCWRCHHMKSKVLKYCHVSAMICQNEKKEDYIKLSKTQHLCEMNKFNPDNYVFDASKQIVHEPNFKVFNYEEFGVRKSKLIIFPTADKSFCYEYALRNDKYYRCLRCQKKRSVGATFYTKKEENCQDYVKLSIIKHVCEMIRFDPENYKFNEEERFVKAPYFKVDSYLQNGVSKKRLFIFTSIEKKLGYEYFFCNRFKKFSCCGCVQLKIQVTAKISQDINGEECIKLNKAKHICQIRNYGIQYGVYYNIFYKPDYQIIEKTTHGKTLKKLYIIIQENRDLCYEFTYFQKQESFVCNRCHSHKSHNYKAFLCYDEEGKEFIRVLDRPHVCQPLPYPKNNSDDDKIIRKPNYKFMKRKCHGKIVEKLVIFANEEKTLCYEYTYAASKRKIWDCCACKNRFKKTVSAKLIKIEDQKEYIELGKNEHECEPIKFDPEDAQLNIVRKPHFMLEKGIISVQRKESKRLTIFNQDDPTLCYYFTCIRGQNYYQCSKCATKKVFVRANYVCLKDGEENDHVILSDTPHICEMEIYTPLISNLRIIKPPNFYLENVKTCHGENERLMIKDWNNENNNLWYTYLWYQSKNSYLCHKCKKFGKTVTAKLYKAENGEDYAELSLIEHVCEPVCREKNE